MNEIIAEKHNEYPRPICKNYGIDLVQCKTNFNKISGFIFNQEWLSMSPGFLVHPFDLAMLKGYIDYNNIQEVTELGCGSTSRFLDRVCKVKRTSYAKEDMLGTGIPFVSCDIFESYDSILESCKNSQLFLIDALHTVGMAEFYLPILKETKIPVFIHDWYLPDEETWPEQNYWIDNILTSYNVFTASRASNPPENSFVHGGIPPCSALLEHL